MDLKIFIDEEVSLSFKINKTTSSLSPMNEIIFTRYILIESENYDDLESIMYIETDSYEKLQYMYIMFTQDIINSKEYLLMKISSNNENDLNLFQMEILQLLDNKSIIIKHSIELGFVKYYFIDDLFDMILLSNFTIYENEEDLNEKLNR